MSKSSVACDDRQEYPPPVLGAGAVAAPQQNPLQVAELVEQEERMVASATEVAVVGAALLVAIGLAHRTVHVQDELRELAALMGLVDPVAGEVHQVFEVLLGGEYYRLEAGHFAGGSGLGVLGPTADHEPHRGIESETLGVVHIFITCQAAVDRLPQPGRQGMLGVRPRAGVEQSARGDAGQLEGVIEFPIGEESGVTGDGRAVELQLELAVEVNAQGVLLAVTHWVPLAFRQERVRNAGFSRVLAQMSYRKPRFIWEMWV
jgi:hypothetical protein